MDPSGIHGEGTRCTGWFDVEAIVERRTGDVVSEDEDENLEDTGVDLVDFIDDTCEFEQAGDEAPRALLHAQETQAHVNAVHYLKRKFTCSPTVSPLGNVQCSIEGELSPRLHAIQLNEGSGKAKRRLFLPDSGYGNTEVETQLSQVAGSDGESQAPGGKENVQPAEGAGGDVRQLLRSSNLKATLLGKFKDVYGIGFNELVRCFKSDKTVCTDWVVGAAGVHHSVAEGLKHLIEPFCTYAHMQCLTCNWGVFLLLLIRFKCGKNRLTVAKCISTLLNVQEPYLLIEPPKLRSTAAALYWYRTGISNVSEVIGEPPEWIVRQTMFQHSLEDSIFDLSQMVQWAYDHDLVDDSAIAYQYAQLADVDSNAAAFLKSNAQAKYVKDCATMCRHYKRAEKQAMTMSQWIRARCDKTDDGGDWRPIVQFLRYQNVEFITFLSAFKAFLKGIPKRSCIVLYGPPNTGKSYFGMSLMQFLQGSIISYVNSNSHFWLAPLAEAKVAMLDDATPQCWSYIDTYMRSVLDGNPMSIDRKHKNLIQMKCPPLIITSNTNVGEDDRWRYLHSRVVVFKFEQTFPFDQNGNPVYELSDKNWKSFFSRTWSRLELQEDEDTEQDGSTVRAFKCVPGQNTNIL
ncbi:E1 [Macaca fascicularis papillomavirus 3]|uniref:Replication protein E1 n=1 Tax=Macaca fascicularis papillomavirus 3 TaxID=471181 RepID=C3PU74_RHPV1|nr:E1 [Macaca fascicularis papillomavirus 3]